MINGEGEAGKRIRALRDEFRKEALISVFESPDELAKLVSVAVGNWERAQGGRPVRAPGLRQWGREWLGATVFARRNARRYLRNLTAQHREFTILQAKTLRLEDIYVSLKVGEYTPRALLPDEPVSQAPHPAVDIGRTVDVLEALLLASHLVVLGDPGCGKTTLLKYLALQLARRAHAFAPFARDRIPTLLTRILEPICRFLSGANMVWPGLILSLIALSVWLVQAFRSSIPFTALVMGFLLLISFVLIWMKFTRKSNLFGIGLSFGILLYAGWWEPKLVGQLAVGLAVLGLGVSLYPFWSRPLISLLRLFLQTATRYPLPVYLPLNDLAHDSRSIEDHFVESLAECGFVHASRFMARQLERGRCVLLLDALDEVVDSQARRRVMTQINRLRAAFGARNQILVTSRIAGFQQTLDGYLRLEVLEFNEEQISSFVRGWFDDRPDAKERQQRIGGLLQALRRSPRMRLLAANPLLLSLMTLLYEYRWRLPERRVELYEECVKLLTDYWDHLRGVTRMPRFPAALKQKVLVELAAGFHATGTRVFERERLLEVLDQLLSPSGLNGSEPSEFLQELMSHTGLLRQKSRSSYDFVHLTFQEYFTARAFRERGDVELLYTHAGEAWWREVIRLYASLEQDATVFLERFHEVDLFLAAGCLADSRASDVPRFRHMAQAIVGDLQELMQRDIPLRQEAADALADIDAWGARSFLIDAVSKDESQPELALGALLALTQVMDQSMEDALLAERGRILRLLHRQLPQVAAYLRARILALLDRLGHPLVYVPAGEFLMGSKGRLYYDARPQHTVTVDEYWIDKFPVTNKKFALFIEESGYRAQGDWRSAFGAGKEEHPVVLVTWDDARAYGE
jgi:hypothetical protein